MKRLMLAVLTACAFAASLPLRAAEEPAAADNKSEYAGKARAELDALGAKIDALEAKAREAGAEARAKSVRQLQGLKSRRRKALKDLAKLKRASGKAWADIRTGLEKGLEDLKKELDETDAD